ncbi:hypothetical protein AAVH_30830 [Aphelenchoides avenae]|nr:hypothetical protein AAVH_30830 [Aphelenchus avenae]
MLASLLLAILFCVSVAAGKCPAGIIQGLSDDCYVYRSKPELWFKADEDCMCRGGHLASVSNRLVNSFLATVSDHYCASEHWLGAGYNTEADDQWVWTDGRPFRILRGAAL